MFNGFKIFLYIFTSYIQVKYLYTLIKRKERNVKMGAREIA